MDPQETTNSVINRMKYKAISYLRQAGKTRLITTFSTCLNTLSVRKEPILSPLKIRNLDIHINCLKATSNDGKKLSLRCFFFFFTRTLTAETINVKQENQQPLFWKALI